MKPSTIIFALLLMAIVKCSAQQPAAKLSGRLVLASCQFPDGKSLVSEYPAQTIREGKVLGGVVPYGEVWPANSTGITFVTDADLHIAGHDVPAGTYFIFFVPAEDRWALILTKSKTLPNSARSSADEFLRINMPVVRIHPTEQTFTISYAPREDRCQLKLRWDDAEVSINVAEKNFVGPFNNSLTYQCPDEYSSGRMGICNNGIGG